MGKKMKSFDGTEIFYDVKHDNKNKFLILLHGLGGDLSAWDKERKDLHELGYSTIAVDLRGHGNSGRPEGLKSYALINFAKDILAIIKKESRQMRAQKPVIIGHCFGGMVAMTLLGYYPDVASALVLIDTSYRPPWFSDILVHSTFFNYILELIVRHSSRKHIKGHADFSQFLNTTDYYWRRIISDILHVSLRSYFLLAKNLTNYDASSLLERIKAPTLIVEGTKDSVFPPDVAEDLHRRIITSEIDYIPGANHIIVLNNPKDLVKSIIKFLKKIKF